MKKIYLLFVFLYSCNFFAQVTQPSNVVSGVENYLGTFNNFDVKFKRNNFNSGLISEVNTSFGDKTFITPPTGFYNCAFGSMALYNLKGGSSNVALGYKALYDVEFGNANLAIGAESMKSSISSDFNIGIGNGVMKKCINDNNNVLVGHSIMQNADYGSYNTVLGNYSLLGSPHTFFNTIVGYMSYNSAENTGQFNIGLGHNTGYLNTTGNNNITIGNQNTAISGSNNILLGHYIIGQNSSNQLNNLLNIGNLIYGSNLNGISSSDDVTSASAMIGIGTDNPQNKLEIKSDETSASPSGLRFTNLKNDNYNQTSTSDKQVLTVNRDGDVILVDDIQGAAFTSACNSSFLAKSDGANGLKCSQVFDNSTSVGIGTGSQSNSYFSWTASPSGATLGNFQSSGNYKLVVNGYTRSLAYLATSDKRYKKDINSIDNALESILKVEGKTYLWDKKANEEIEFDDNLHSGFLAQDLEKIFPHLVVTSETGEKAVNYMELIPYLVESIKDQQNQIDRLTQLIEEKNETTYNISETKFNVSKINSVFPNPTSDILNVAIDVNEQDRNVSLQLIDFNGNVVNKLIVQEKGKDINKKIFKDNFIKGVYVLNLVVDSKKVDTMKVIFN